MTVETLSSNSSNSGNTSTSSGNSSVSRLHLTGDGDDGLTVGSSGSDFYRVSTGRDDYDGNGGYDTLYEIPEGSIVLRGLDVRGNYTGVINKKFIYIKVRKPDGTLDDSYTAAWEVEGIEYEDSDITYDVSSFNSTNYFLLKSIDLTDQNLNNNQTVTVDLSSKFYAENEGTSTTYSFSSSNSALSDQISLNGNILSIKSGSSGPKISTTVTIEASEISINNNRAQTLSETFTVTMTDDDYSGTARETEPNDLYDYAKALDPNYDTDKFTSQTYSSDTIIKGNLSSKGDYDRYWINLDKGETIKIKFDPPWNSDTESYKIFWLRESTGEVFKTLETEAGYIYNRSFTAPSEGVYQIVITSNDSDDAFSNGDYELSITDFTNPTNNISTKFLDLNSDYDAYEDPLKGTSADNTLNGSSAGETIDGLDGDDTIYGNNGSDTIDGGNGDDKIFGGKGRDDIYVSLGKDTIDAGSGIDILTVPDDSWNVLRVIDVYGTYFNKGDEYIYVSSSDGKSTTRAKGIELISIFKLDSNGNQVWVNTNERDSTFSIKTFDYWDGYFKISKYKEIQDQTVAYNSSNLKINLKDYLSTINYGQTTEYNITSPQSQNYLSINGDILTISTRSGNYDSIPITITAKNIKPDGTKYSNDEGKTVTFTVTFAPDLVGDENDNEINGTSGDDIYNVTDGFDVVDGKSGTDTIVIPYNAGIIDFYPTLLSDEQKNGRGNHSEAISNYSVVKSIDIDGSVTGTVGQEYLNIVKFFDPVSIFPKLLGVS